MKFLTALVPKDYLEDQGTDGLFKGQDGEYYFYQVTFYEDDSIVITDSVGRIMPMGVEELGGLHRVIGKVIQYQAEKAICQDLLYKNLVNGAST